MSVCGGEDLLEEHADHNGNGGFGREVRNCDDRTCADVAHASKECDRDHCVFFLFEYPADNKGQVIAAKGDQKYSRRNFDQFPIDMAQIRSNHRAVD